jgi:hypothetical protein
VPLLPIASWNEWTEGHAVAPCDRHGDGLLRVLREFKNALPGQAGPAAPSSRDRADAGVPAC